MSKKSFTVTMESDLQAEIDRVGARDDRSRNYVINHLCRTFLSQGAVHPGGQPTPTTINHPGPATAGTPAAVPPIPPVNQPPTPPVPPPTPPPLPPPKTNPTPAGTPAQNDGRAA